MGFLSRYEGTEKLDFSDLATDGNEYWVEVKLALSGDEWDLADAAQTQINASITQAASKRARAELARRRAARGESDEDAVNTLIRFDQRAYNEAVLNFGIVGWNLTDAYDRPLFLPPIEEKAARAVTIARLPRPMRKRIIEFLEASKNEAGTAEEAEFPDDLPAGGGDGRELGSADPGAVAEGGVVLAHWADDRAGVEDLQSA